MASPDPVAIGTLLRCLSTESVASSTPSAQIPQIRGSNAPSLSLLEIIQGGVLLVDLITPETLVYF
jgi:hypothetical protein